MNFDQLLDQAMGILQRRGRLTYRSLKRQFGLDDAWLADLVNELIEGQLVARDVDGRIIEWIGPPAAAPESGAWPAAGSGPWPAAPSGPWPAAGSGPWPATGSGPWPTPTPVPQHPTLQTPTPQTPTPHTHAPQTPTPHTHAPQTPTPHTPTPQTAIPAPAAASGWWRTPVDGPAPGGARETHELASPLPAPETDPRSAAGSSSGELPQGDRPMRGRTHDEWPAVQPDQTALGLTPDDPGFSTTITVPQAPIHRRASDEITLERLDDPQGINARNPSAERRRLTVMFCDLVGSTALSGRLDPEDLREVVREYQRAAESEIRLFDGFVAQYLGDGILVYFGYPRAHEDDARRAVQAGLSIIESLEPLNRRLEPEQGVRLSVRIGIHTGLVVVGEMGSGAGKQQLALGETPNVAARVQGLADPDQVLMSAATHRLVERDFESEALGDRALKGVESAMAIYRVLGRIDTWHDGGGSIDLNALIGRGTEVGLLRDRWREAAAGAGAHAALVGGEAGIGKSTLTTGLRTEASADGAVVLDFRCSPYHANSALFPIVDHIAHRAGVSAVFDLDERMARVEAFVRAQGLDDAALPLIGALLNLPVAERFPDFRQLSPGAVREMTQELVLDLLLRESERQPILTVWEDLHWADPSTLEVLGMLLDRMTTERAMHVLTFRPEFSPPWPVRPNRTLLMLQRFSRDDVREMAETVVDGRRLPTAVVDQIAAKTDGVPLFVEEVTKLLVESDFLREAGDHYELVGELPAVAVPSTLHDSLMARLDRLHQAKEVAQLGAIIGRSFTHELISQLWPGDGRALRAGLANLVDAELLFRSGGSRNPRYLFKHALIQDLAYESLLKRTRQGHHARMADLLEASYPDLVDGQPELVAHHLTGAGEAARAIPYWRIAGERAVEGSAHVEAIGHLQRALDLLSTLPEDDEHLEQRLDTHIKLGVSLTANRGYASPQVEENYVQARALCERLGSAARLAPVLYGMWRFYLISAQYRQGAEVAGQLMRVAETERRPEYQMAAHRALGGNYFYQARYRESVEHLDVVLDIEPDTELRHRAFLYDVVDAWVACHAYSSWDHWMLGDAERGRTHSETSLTAARAIEHPFSVSLATNFATWFHQLRRDVPRTRALAESALQLATEHRFALWMGWSMTLQGWAIAEAGEGEAGVGTMRRGIELWLESGSMLGMPYFKGLLAEQLGRRGRTDEGLMLLDEAQGLSDELDERWYLPELHRLRGEMHLHRREEDLAQESFLTAIGLAKTQGARFFELRAALGLGRSLRLAGDEEAAVEAVRPVYDQLTGQTDAVDVEAARRFLEDGLSASVELYSGP